MKDKPEKIKKAAALSYTPEKDNAPRVVAAGRGVIAEKIIEKARKAKIPVYEDERLAESLSELKLGSEIPYELYDVVAEVLAFISRLDGKYRRYEV